MRRFYLGCAILLVFGLLTSGCKSVDMSKAYCRKDLCDFTDPVGTAPTDPRNPMVAR